MDEVISDVRSMLEEHHKLRDVRDAGGIHVLPDLEMYPEHVKPPVILVIDDATLAYEHHSSRTRLARMGVRVHVIQIVHKRGGAIEGTGKKRGVEEIAKSVMDIVDGNRLNGKYVSVFVTGADRPTPFMSKNRFLLEKALTFVFTKLESMQGGS